MKGSFLQSTLPGPLSAPPVLPPFASLLYSSMNSDLLSSIVCLLSAAPASPPHDHLDVTIYENGFATSSLLATPVLSDPSPSKAYPSPRLFVAIRSALVRAAIRWPTMIPTHQIADSLPEALFIIQRCQAVFFRSEFALLVSGDSAQDIISRCHHLNDKICWDAIMALEAQTRPTAFEHVPIDPLIEQYLNVGEFHRETPLYEQTAQHNEYYDGPLFDDWSPSAYFSSCEPGSNIAEPHHYPQTSMPTYTLPSGVYSVEYSALDSHAHDISVSIGEPTFQPFSEYQETVTIHSFEDSPSPSSTCSSPFPETPAFDNFRSELPHVVSPRFTVVRDVTGQEEHHTNKATQIVHSVYSTSPAPVVAPSPPPECESLPFSRHSSVTPSSQSSQRSSTSPSPSEESFQAPVRVAGKKARRTRTGAIRKKKTKSKEKHFCCYCNESFTRDHDAERHQRTCKSNPNCSQKEQCKICSKPLPVRLDARRRHWGTLECSDAARKRGVTQVDEEVYEIL